MVVYHSGGQGISHNCIRCVKWYTVKNLWLRTLLWPFQRFVIQHVNNMLTDQRSLVGSLFTVCETFKDGLWVSQPRLSRGKRESGQILIRLLYCILSSRVPNEVGVNINWDTFCKGRSSVSLNSLPKKATSRLHSSLTQLTRHEILGVLEMRWWWEIDQTLSLRENLARETVPSIQFCWITSLRACDRSKTGHWEGPGTKLNHVYCSVNRCMGAALWRQKHSLQQLHSKMEIQGWAYF